MKKISLSDFAKKVGVNRATITNAVKSGRLKSYNDELGRPHLNEEEAELDWFKNADQERMKTAAAVKSQKSVAKPEADTEITVTKGRALKEHYLAKTARLNFEERIGDLIPAKEVRDGAFKAARTLRNALFAIPDRLAGELAAETNQFHVHKKLTDEIRRVLESMKEIKLDDKG